MTLADTAAAAASVGRPAATIRTWARRGLLTRHGKRGRHTLYDLDEVRMTDNHQRAAEHFGQDSIDAAALAIVMLPDFRFHFAPDFTHATHRSAVTFAEAALAAVARQPHAELDKQP